MKCIFSELIIPQQRKSSKNLCMVYKRPPLPVDVVTGSPVVFWTVLVLGGLFEELRLSLWIQKLCKENMGWIACYPDPQICCWGWG